MTAGKDTVQDQDPTREDLEQILIPQPIAMLGVRTPGYDPAVLSRLGKSAVMMMGDNPALATMPKAPRLLDFFRLRFLQLDYRHLLQSAKNALDAGHGDKVVITCLLHDISSGALIRTDHGYWGSQLVAPYVSEEIAWAIKYHQALRYFPDESVGYEYPQSYYRFFGRDFQPPEYIRKAYEEARAHRWYMTSRLVTVYDEYSFQENWHVDPEQFTDIIERNFRQPREGLGFDGSATAHMWRTMIWPNNFL